MANLLHLEGRKYQKGLGFALPEEKVQQGEVLLAQFRNITVYDDKEVTIQGDCTGVVSTHCIYIHDSTFSFLASLPIQSVTQFKLHANMFRRTHVVYIHYTGTTNQTGSLDNAASSASSAADSVFATKVNTSIKLRFPNKDGESFKKSLDSAMSKKLWNRKTQAPQPAKFPERAAGVKGILERQERERERTSQLTSEAFADLEALMDRAESLIKLISRFSQMKARRKQERVVTSTEQVTVSTTMVSQAGSSEVTQSIFRSSEQNVMSPGATESKSEVEEFEKLLQQIGIVDPVTKRNAGSRYHHELAFELYNFLHQNRTRYCKSGVITLSDLYCVVNRARGSQLVSPNDIFQAASLLEQVGKEYSSVQLPSTSTNATQGGAAATVGSAFYLKKLSSGVLVVLDKGAGIDRRVMEILERDGKITSAVVSEDLKISLDLAAEFLKDLETRQVLCRDVTLVATNFFANRFKDVELC